VQRLHLVRNGLELERFPYLPRGEMRPVPQVLAVGRLVEKKGFALLIDAIAALRDRGTVMTASIVGDGPLREELAARIAEHDLEDRVELLGPRTQEEVRALLQEADLFAAPFVIAEDGNADGLPTVLLEAMASGIPCIAADVTAVGEVIRTGGTGWLIPCDDSAALVEALQDAASSTSRRALTDAARALIEQEYASPRQAARLRALVQDGEGPAESGAAAHPAPLATTTRS
jgi:glycosyltransferase involved in cell wall biosynthesis